MNLNVKINGIEYKNKLSQGCTISEEYNETLDSGSIILSQIKGKILDLMPYDDVYIYSGKFDGFFNDNLYCYNKTISASSFEISDEDLSYRETFYLPVRFQILLNEYKIIDDKSTIKILLENEGLTEEHPYRIVKGDDFGTFFKLVPEIETDAFPVYNFIHESNGYRCIVSRNLGTATLRSHIIFNLFYIKYDDGNINNVYIDSLPEDYVKKPDVYFHLLVDQFSEEHLSLVDDTYKYKIELFSETKKLETIQLPNISITQPLNIEKKKSVYNYICQFVDMYTPMIKVAKDIITQTWSYKKKYRVDKSLQDIFSNVYSPDFSLNNPNLRDVLAKLFLTKDKIPYVKDDVIYAMDITERKGKFDLDTRYVNYITGSRSSDNYCDNVRRGYSEALSQDYSCRMVEYLGFRNSDSSLLTIDNMRLETRYPIYKINNVYMCYYKKAKTINVQTGESNQKIFLCKQDITKLVKLENERNLLSQDWNDFSNLYPLTIDDLAKYKLATVGYSIGSKYISGWGEKYTYPLSDSWWDVTKTYIQNIVERMDNMFPFGIYSYDYLKKIGNIPENDIFTPISFKFEDNFINPFSNDSLGQKGLFFIVDYNAFYSGAVIHSKDINRDNVTMNDNSSSSLTLLEQDGIFQKEKLDRFGNKAIQINARYTDFSQIQLLGSVYEDKYEKDIIIYHREYSITDNVINCVYYGTKDYVLKNYFTSVYARHRTYNLMSYSESILRSENEKMMILFSKDKSYYENENFKLNFEKFYDADYLEKIVSFYKPTSQALAIDYFEKPDRIDYGYISFYGPNYDDSGEITSYSKKYYSSDLNAFVSGVSLCFNMRMFDNVSAGVYIDIREPIVDETVKDDFTGSVQKWYMTVDDLETGFVEKMGFYVSHKDAYEEYYEDKIVDLNDENINLIKTNIYDKLFALPKISNISIENNDSIYNVIGNEFKINKDNKEIIDMTFQFEGVVSEDDVKLSSWSMKLSDLISTYNKHEVDYNKNNETYRSLNITGTLGMYRSTENTAVVGNQYFYIALSMNKNVFNYLLNKYNENPDEEIDVDINLSTLINTSGATGYLSSFDIDSYSLHITKIISLNELVMVIKGKQVITHNSESDSDVVYTYEDDVTFQLKINNYWANTKELTVEKNNVTFANLEWRDYGDYKDSPQYDYYVESNRIKYTQLDGETVIEIPIDIPTILYGIPGYGYMYNLKEGKPSSNNNFNVNGEAYIIEEKNKDYQKNMIITYSYDAMKKDLIYDEYSLEQLNMTSNGQPVYGYLFTTEPISNIITYQIDEKNAPYIEINLNKGISKLAKSIQYWYLYGGSCKFVFGVNISDKDWEKGYIKVYLSMLSTRDTRVYDNLNNVVGEIYNYADENNTKTYGEGQYYCDIIK